MENNKENKEFRYTYSAKDQEELKRIREKYCSVPDEQENKMERLRKLDASVTNAALSASLVLGVVGALILGFGMSLIMTELSVILGAYRDKAMMIGISVGVVGGIIASLAYPIYRATVKHKRKKIAPEILRLADELLK